MRRCAAILDVDAVHEHPLQGAVPLEERGCVDARELAEGVLERLGREIGVETGERAVRVSGPISGPWRIV
jgi:hypothetical protein